MHTKNENCQESRCCATSTCMKISFCMKVYHMPEYKDFRVWKFWMLQYVAVNMSTPHQCNLLLEARLLKLQTQLSLTCESQRRNKGHWVQRGQEDRNKSRHKFFTQPLDYVWILLDTKLYNCGSIYCSIVSVPLTPCGTIVGRHMIAISCGKNCSLVCKSVLRPKILQTFS